ncbi:MAG TPA: DoxX family protein [Dehalococcoidia bacterium]|nr:DoxX family protein [Dehalococcoidia bacterium]
MALLTKAFERRELRDPGIFRAIFSNTWLAPILLFLRLYLGYQWLIAGSHKLWGSERWIAVNGPDGLALRGYWERQTAIPEQGRPAISFDWYRDFLTFMLDHEWYRWFAWVIAIGEVAMGVLLIVGAFVGIAALFGAFMNFNFLMAGSASINPVMFVVAMLVIFGWKTAGWIGLDRWLLPALGTPWQPGPAFKSLFRPRVVNEACPVCEMPVEMGRSPTSVYNGLTYLSCCPVCKEHLDAEPTRYLRPAAGTA